MKMSADGIALLKKLEGCRLKAYKDSVGEWTIGYGTTSMTGFGKITMGMTITQDMADTWLVEGLVKYEKAVSLALTRVPTQNQFDAMVSLCYNIGPGKFAGSSGVRSFNAGNQAKAANDFLEWNKTRDRKTNVLGFSSGLARRRALEMELFLRPGKPVQTVPPGDMPQVPTLPPKGLEKPSIGVVMAILGAIIAAIAAYFGLK